MNSDILKKIQLIDMQVRKKVDSLFSGHNSSLFKGQGMVFSDVREYVPGDSLRSISWNLLAKTGKPYVKTFEEERESPMLIVADISSSFKFGTGKYSKRDVLNNLGSFLAFCSNKCQDPVGLLLFSGDVDLYLPPEKGVAHIFRIMKELLEKESVSRVTSLRAPISFLSEVLKKRSHVFILSDFLLQSDWERDLKYLTKRHEVVGVGIHDLFEYKFPKLGLVDIQDAETGEIQSVSSSSIDFQNELKKMQKVHQDTSQKAFLKAGARFIQINTDKDIYDPVIKFFNKKD